MTSREASEKYLPGALSGLFVTIIGGLILINVQAKNLNAESLKIEIDSKASKVELKDAIDTHEKKDEVRYQGLEKLLLIIIDEQKETGKDVKQLMMRE